MREKEGTGATPWSPKAHEHELGYFLDEFSVSGHLFHQVAWPTFTKVAGQFCYF